MYLGAEITIDPSQLTRLERVRPTKGFARIANILTGGIVKTTEEHETFSAVVILQQINVVMRSCEIDNVVRLAADDVTFYEDTKGETDDLKQALDEFEARANPEDVKLFDNLNLVLEHHKDNLAYLLDINIWRTHAVGDFPIEISVTGTPKRLNAKEGEKQVRQNMTSVFRSQSNYDDFIDKHKREFDKFLDKLATAFESKMLVDTVTVNSKVNIIRPSNRIKHRSEVPSSTYGYHGCDDMFFYTWLWSGACHSNDIRCHDCTIVDTFGNDVLDVGSYGFQAGQGSTMNPDEPFSVPESPDININSNSEYSAEIEAAKVPSTSTGGDVDSTSSDDTSKGWSFSDFFGGDWGGDSGGDSGGCGGGCGGGD